MRTSIWCINCKQKQLDKRFDNKQMRSNTCKSIAERMNSFYGTHFPAINSVGMKRQCFDLGVRLVSFPAKKGECLVYFMCVTDHGYTQHHVGLDIHVCSSNSTFKTTPVFFRVDITSVCYLHFWKSAIYRCPHAKSFQTFLLIFLQNCELHNIQNGKPEFKANTTHSESTKPVCFVV